MSRARAITKLRRRRALAAAAVLAAAVGLGLRERSAPAAGSDLAAFGLDTPIGRVGGETLRVRDLPDDDRRAIERLLARIDEAKRAALSRLEDEALLAADRGSARPTGGAGPAAGFAAMASAPAGGARSAGDPAAIGGEAISGTPIDDAARGGTAIRGDAIDGTAFDDATIGDAAIDAVLRRMPPIPAAAGPPRELARHVLAIRARDAARSERVARLRAEAGAERFAPPPGTAAGAPWPEVASRVGSRAITVSDVEREARLRLFWLRGELAARAALAFSARADALLLAREAAARGATPEQLAAGITAPVTAVAEADVDAELGRHGLPAGDHPERRARARDLLAFRAREAARHDLLARLREKAPVVFLLAPPTPPRVEVEGARPGPGDPAVTIVAFTNLRCRVCAATSAVLDAVESGRYAGRVRVLRRPLFPEAALPLLADAMAEACAAEQGAGPALRRAVFAAASDAAPGAGAALSSATPAPITVPGGAPGGAEGEAASESRAGAAGAALGVVPDRDRFSRCMADPRTRETVAAQRDEAERLGFADAPGFLVNGLPLTGFQGQARLESILAAELAPAATSDATPASSNGRL